MPTSAGGGKLKEKKAPEKAPRGGREKQDGRGSSGGPEAACSPSPPRTRQSELKTPRKQKVHIAPGSERGAGPAVRRRPKTPLAGVGEEAGERTGASGGRPSCDWQLLPRDSAFSPTSGPTGSRSPTLSELSSPQRLEGETEGGSAGVARHSSSPKRRDILDPEAPPFRYKSIKAAHAIMKTRKTQLSPSDVSSVDEGGEINLPRSPRELTQRVGSATYSEQWDHHTSYAAESDGEVISDREDREIAKTLSPLSPPRLAVGSKVDKTLTQDLLGERLDGFFHKLSNHLDNKFERFEVKINSMMETLYTKTTYLENKYEALVKSHNELIDDHYKLKKEVDLLKSKHADSEDRDRRCNLKIRGIPESVKNAELEKYVASLFSKIIPKASQQELLQDRVHRVYKPDYLPKDLPRDVLTRLHYYKTKDDILTKVKKMSGLPHPYNKLQIYTDLSAATLKRRKEFLPVTTHLREHKVLYRWGFPTKLIIIKDGTMCSLFNLENTDRFLKDLGLPPLRDRADASRPRPDLSGGADRETSVKKKKK